MSSGRTGRITIGSKLIFSLCCHFKYTSNREKKKKTHGRTLTRIVRNEHIDRICASLVSHIYLCSYGKSAVMEINPVSWIH